MTKLLTVAGLLALVVTAHIIVNSPGEQVDLSVAELQRLERFAREHCDAAALGLPGGTPIQEFRVTRYEAKRSLLGALVRTTPSVDGRPLPGVVVFRLQRDPAGALVPSSLSSELAWTLGDVL